MSLLILVVDDERDVEALFRQQFRRDLRAGRFTMEFAYSVSAALDRIENAAEASLIQPIQRFLAAGWPIKGSWIAYLDLHHLSHRDQASGIFDRRTSKIPLPPERLPETPHSPSAHVAHHDQCN